MNVVFSFKSNFAISNWTSYQAPILVVFLDPYTTIGIHFILCTCALYNVHRMYNVYYTLYILCTLFYIVYRMYIVQCTFHVDDVPKIEWHLYREPRWNILNKHSQKLAKKLDWLKYLNNTKFKHWPAKGKEKEENHAAKRSRTAACKAARNRKKRNKRRKRALENRIKMVKEEHLVFNLIPPEDLAVPDEALAVLSNGEGFVPTPKYDREQFRLQAFNAKNKLEKCANSQAKKLEQNSNEEPLNDSDTNAALVIRSELRLRGVCLPPANEHGDPLRS